MRYCSAVLSLHALTVRAFELKGDGITHSGEPPSTLKLVPAGHLFTMGSSSTTPLAGKGIAMPGREFGDFDEHPARHDIAVSSFYLGVREVTNAEYERFDPSHRLLRGFEHGYSVGDDEAVVFVSHINATRYCNWLNSEQPRGHDLRYRLPTEEEWEYAARAGTNANFWWGDDFEATRAHSPGTTCPQNCPNLTVAQFLPNPFGLYDMIGNVEEWTSTVYAPYPGGNPAYFSAGLFVTRGGGHSNDPSPFYLRAANRAAALPTERSSVIGFRVAASVASDDLGSVVKLSVAATNVATKSESLPAELIAQDEWHDVLSAAAPTKQNAVWHGPFEYVRFSPDITSHSGGPLFLQHNHAPSMGILPDGKTIILAWFSTVTENGREPSYAYSTLDVSQASSIADDWKNASLLWKVADRGQQTMAFHSSPDGSLSWYACVAPAAGYISASIVRRDFDPTAELWSDPKFVTFATDRLPHVSKNGMNYSIEAVPSHADGHIPFERVVELPAVPGQPRALGMPATYLGVIASRCKGCAASASSVLLRSTDNGWNWSPASSTAFMSGISQFVSLRNGSLLALGRGGSNVPTEACPWLTRSVSHNNGRTWEHGWFEGLWPVGGGHRMVLFRLREGPILLISFTGGSNTTTITGKERRFSGLYAATSIDEGNSFQIKKPLVDESAPPTQLSSMDKIPWTMTNSTAEPRGYTTARQTADGMIHVASSRLSYHFNLAWLNTPPPDASDAPLPTPTPAPTPRGPAVPAGSWYTTRVDWEMNSPTAHRTIRAIRNTSFHSEPTGGEEFIVEHSWAYVLVTAPTSTGIHNTTWKVECPCVRH